jgi:hypothetical protein
MAMLFITASLMTCGDSAAGHRGTIPVPAMMAAAFMLRLVACCSGVLPGVAVRLRNVPKSSNSSIIVTPENHNSILTGRTRCSAGKFLFAARHFGMKRTILMAVKIGMRSLLSPARQILG